MSNELVYFLLEILFSNCFKNTAFFSAEEILLERLLAWSTQYTYHNDTLSRNEFLSGFKNAKKGSNKCTCLNLAKRSGSKTFV